MKPTGVTPIQPASCSAATPLPIRITASTATQADVHEKNLLIGMRALLRSKAQAITDAVARYISSRLFEYEEEKKYIYPKVLVTLKIIEK